MLSVQFSFKKDNKWSALYENKWGLSFVGLKTHFPPFFTLKNPKYLDKPIHSLKN